MTFGDDFTWGCETCGDEIVGRTPQQLRKLWRDHKATHHESSGVADRGAVSAEASGS